MPLMLRVDLAGTRTDLIVLPFTLASRTMAARAFFEFLMVKLPRPRPANGVADPGQRLGVSKTEAEMGAMAGLTTNPT